MASRGDTTASFWSPRPAAGNGCAASGPVTVEGSISRPLNCASTRAGSSALAARGARRAAFASADMLSLGVSSAPTAASTTSGSSKPCSVPGGRRCSSLPAWHASDRRGTGRACCRRVRRRSVVQGVVPSARRAPAFSVSVETVASRRFFVEASRRGRDCVDTAESAIEKRAVVAGAGAGTARQCHWNFSRPHCRMASTATEAILRRFSGFKTTRRAA